MVFVLELLALAYVISMVVMYIVARSAIRDRYWRATFCLIGAAVPFVAVFVIVKNLIHPSQCRVPAYVSEIAVVEDAIEAERVKIFGVEKLCPSFAERWQESCRFDMQRVVVWSDKTTRWLKSFGHSGFRPVA